MENIENKLVLETLSADEYWDRYAEAVIRLPKIRGNPMPSRADAARMASYLIDDSVAKTIPDEWPVFDREKGRQFHVGKQEFRHLLDFIYGGPPQSDDELIR